MTIENNAIRNEPSTLPAWLVVGGIIVAAVLIVVGIARSHLQ